MKGFIVLLLCLFCLTGCGKSLQGTWKVNSPGTQRILTAPYLRMMRTSPYYRLPFPVQSSFDPMALLPRRLER